MKYVFWAVIGVLLLVQALAYVTWRIALYSPHKGQGDDHRLSDTDQVRPLAPAIHRMIDEVNAIPYERCEIVSFDGLKLTGRYYSTEEGAPVAICFHGYRGTPSRDFSGGTHLYRKAGLNLLMVDQRAHGQSEGHAITLGVRERRDCLSWIAYAAERFGADRKLMLAGISMGAATVLMASGMPLPKSVRGIVADAPYTTPRAITLCVAKSLHLPPHPVWWLLRLGSWLYAGASLSDREANAAEAAARSSVPILLLHGEDDRLVPCDMGRVIAAAAPKTVELHTFAHAGHGLSCPTDPVRYERIVRAFLTKTLE